MSKWKTKDIFGPTANPTDDLAGLCAYLASIPLDHRTKSEIILDWLDNDNAELTPDLIPHIQIAMGDRPTTGEPAT